MITMDLLRKISTSELNVKMVDIFLKEKRGMLDDDPRVALRDELVSRGVFYVPFHSYFSKVFGKETTNEFKDYFNQGKCILTECLSIPMCTIKENFMGIIINNPKNKPKYRYPNSFDAQKDRYLQLTKDNFLKALDRKFIILQEGVFDEFSVSATGLPSCSFGGSEVSKNTFKIVDLIPTKVVISDNDSAGDKLYSSIEKKSTGKVVIVKLPTKDCDEFLRDTKNRNKFIAELEKNERQGFPLKLVKVE